MVSYLPDIMIISTEQEAFIRFAPLGVSRRVTFRGVIFVLVTDGVALVDIDGRPKSLSAGGLLAMLPSHLLGTRSLSDDFRCLTLAFEFDSMMDFPYMVQTTITEKMETMPVVELECEQMQELVELHRVVVNHYLKAEHPSYVEILRSLAFVFTAQVSAIYGNMTVRSSATHREELIDGFFRLLHEHCRTHRSSTFYADKLCVSPKYLAKTLVGTTGHSPSYWIADFTVREAKTMLRSTAMTITQVSEELNFANSSFFARYFKRYAGVAPGEYRK